MWNKKEMSQLDATMTRIPLTLSFDLDIWPWILWPNCISWMGGPIVMERKGRESMGCPDVKWVNWTLHWLGYLWPWNLTLKFQGQMYLRNRRPECHRTKGTGVDRMPWCDTLRKWVIWMLRWLGYLWPWPLTLNCENHIVSREWETRMSWNEGDGSR